MQMIQLATSSLSKYSFTTLGCSAAEHKFAPAGPQLTLLGVGSQLALLNLMKDVRSKNLVWMLAHGLLPSFELMWCNHSIQIIRQGLFTDCRTGL